MRILIVIFILLIGNTSTNLAKGQEFIIGERITSRSEILNEDRSLLIYVPKSYNANTQRYPVMYVLDGSAHFHHATGIVQYLSSRGLMPEMIVVAVVNVNRDRDFSPIPEPAYPGTGGAPKFISYFSEELIPYIEKNYRTTPYRMIVGHSLGGTFATYAMVDFPDVFNSYIAISPFLHFQNGIFIDEIEKKFKGFIKGKRQYFMSVGNEPYYLEPLSRFEKIMKSSIPESFGFKYVQFLDHDHMTVPHISMYHGLLFIYSGWKLDPEKAVKGLEYIDKHYKKLSRKYGYEIAPPEATINLLGYSLYRQGFVEEAIEVFRENVERYPNSANVYDSLGEVYEGVLWFEEAENNYLKAVELAKKSNHPNLSLYTEHLKRIQKKQNR